MKRRLRFRHVNPIALYMMGILNLILIYSILFLYLRDEFSGTDSGVITAVYWVIQTITTLGYGEIYPVSSLGRLLVTIIIFSGIVSIFVFFPMVLTPWLERRIRRLPTKVNMGGHIVICGYSALVETLIEELEQSNRWFVLIDNNEQTIRDLLEQDIPCIYGDPSDKLVLENACVSEATVLVSNKRGEENANIILTASKLSDADMIAIVDDIAMEKFLTYVGATAVLSPRQLLGTYMGRQALLPAVHGLMEIDRLHPKLTFKEVLVSRGCDLVGKSIEESGIRSKTGATIIGISKDDKVILNPDPEAVVIGEENLLFVIGSEEQLNRLDELMFRGGVKRDYGLYILAGYGDVGKQVAGILHKKGVDFTVIDVRDVKDGSDGDDGGRRGKEKDKIKLLLGDATEEEVLKAAKIDKASTFIVALNEDCLNIYTTIVARKLNPKIRIISRANAVNSVDKLYDAGADSAFSLSSICGRMLARTISLHIEGEIRLTEGLIVRIHKARGNLFDKKVGDLKIRSITGCTLVGMGEGENFIANPGANAVISENSELLVAGTKEQLRIFEREYGYIDYRNIFRK